MVPSCSRRFVQQVENCLLRTRGVLVFSMETLNCAHAGHTLSASIKIRIQTHTFITHNAYNPTLQKSTESTIIETLILYWCALQALKTFQDQGIDENVPDGNDYDREKLNATDMLEKNSVTEEFTKPNVDTDPFAQKPVS